MHSGCSTDTRAAVMNAGTVRLSIIAMLMLATFGITSAQETSTQKAASVAGPVLSNTGHDAAAYGADEGYPLGTLATGAEMRHLVATYSHFDELTPARIVCTCSSILVVSARRRARDLLQLRRRAPHDRGLSQPTAYDRIAARQGRHCFIRTLSIRAIGSRSLSLPVDGEDHHLDADRHRYGRRSHQIDR